MILYKNCILSLVHSCFSCGGNYVVNEKLKMKCGQYKIDLIEADINRDFKEVLLPYLIKRSKLF